LRKNIHVLCEVYDDYDLYEKKFELVAVGLQPNSYYYSYFEGFSYGNSTKIEVLELKVNNVSQPIIYNNYSLEIRKKLYNNEKANIYIKYKYTDNENKKVLLRDSYYGFFNNNAGEKGKFIVKIKGDWTVISVKDDIVTRTEIDEYVWAGKIPLNGCRTLFRLSKKTATFKMKIINSIKNLNINSNIKSVQYSFPIEFYGGNINIISMKNSCNLTNDIKIKNQSYDLTLKNKSFEELYFITKCTIQNRSSGQWNVTISEDEIKRENEKIIKNEKNELERIAKEIINNDNSNIPAYIKICKWVYNNIKYNLSYTGKDLTPLQIYRIKTGVCHHMTILFNSLLYSIGYLTIYVYGFIVDKTFPNVDESGPHAWSLVKINNKWIPFDSTWGIWSGNLPNCHIFSNFFNKDSILYTGGNDYVQTDYIINGRYISSN
jgi:hypothetical protein